MNELKNKWILSEMNRGMWWESSVTGRGSWKQRKARGKKRSRGKSSGVSRNLVDNKSIEIQRADDFDQWNKSPLVSRHLGTDGFTKRVLKAITKERLAEALISGPKLCVDLSMTDSMSDKVKCRQGSSLTIFSSKELGILVNAHCARVF